MIFDEFEPNLCVFTIAERLGESIEESICALILEAFNMRVVPFAAVVGLLKYFTMPFAVFLEPFDGPILVLTDMSYFFKHSSC